MRYAPGPKIDEASTMPLDSHAPQLPGVRSSTSVGPASADCSTFATTAGAPENGTHQSRAVVALGSVDPAGNCWLLPGSSVTNRPFGVDSRLSGWWISLSVCTGLSSPSWNIESESTCVASFGSSTIFQMRPLVERPACGDPVVPRPESMTYTTFPMPGRLSYAMSSTRTNSKTLFSTAQYWRTHCGPSMPIAGARRSRCQLPSAGGSGKPTSSARISVPSAFNPVAMFSGTWTK